LLGRERVKIKKFKNLKFLFPISASQLGDRTSITKPYAVATALNGALSGKVVKSLGLGFNKHACLIDTNFNLYCWGNNA
jgi:hypothetical protein